MVLVIGLVSTIRYFKHAAPPLETIVKLDPIGDSPASMIDGLHNVVTQTAIQIESIKDRSSRDVAADNLDILAEAPKSCKCEPFAWGRCPTKNAPHWSSDSTSRSFRCGAD